MTSSLSSNIVKWNYINFEKEEKHIINSDSRVELLAEILSVPAGTAKAVAKTALGKGTLQNGEGFREGLFAEDVTEEVKIDEELEGAFAEDLDDSDFDEEVLDEDDILNIKEYVSKNIGIAKAKELLDSRYFDVLARIIPMVQPREWPKLLSKLWYDNSQITDLFSRLLEGYEVVGFASCVYVPISALRNTSMTLMGSLCLQSIQT